MKISAGNITQRFHETPLLLCPQFTAQIKHLPDDSHMEDKVPFDEMCASAYGYGVTARDKPFVFSNGIAFIPVQGMLLHKYNYSWEGATGYDYIRSRFDAALLDDDVKGIVFNVDSPGGQVAGNFELCDHIHANRDKKPMMALVDTMAYSGGYSLASAVGNIVATPSGGAGSIGVVMMHVSVARAMKSYGVDVNLIYAGAHKVDGSPFKELSEDARTRFQAGVDRSYDQFVSLVARNRGLDADAVKATEALTYDAQEAKRIGLIDAVQEPIAALAAFHKGLSGSTTFTGGNAMSTATKPEAANNASADDTKEISTVTTIDQKARIKAIMSCEQAKNRRTLAEHIAFNTDMSVEDAAAMLAAAAEDKPQAAENANGDAFVRAMNEGGGAGVDAAADGTGSPELSVGDRIARTYQAMNGVKVN